MFLKRSLLRNSASALVLLGLMTGPAYAGSGSITYNIDYITTFGSNGNNAGEFNGLEQIKIGTDNNLYVVDRFNKRIQVFDKDGTYLSQFGANGSGPGQFSDPYGLTIGTNGRIIVSDLSGRVQFFDPTTYAYDGEFGTPAGPFDGLSVPTYLAVDASGNIYVQEYGSNQISIFDQSGTYITQLNEPNPIGIAIAPDGRIYISTNSANYISIYDSSYSLLGYLATGGTGPGQLYEPLGIASDEQGNIYVSDRQNNRIQVFDKNNHFLFEYNGSATAPGQIISPTGIEVDQQGNIFIAESTTDRIRKLTLTSTETFTGSPAGGDETAATPLSNLILQNGGVFADDFIGYHDADISGTSWELSGTNDFSGTVSVTATNLINNGTFGGTSISIDPATILSGSGNYLGDLTVNGTFSPGANAGDIITTTINGTYTHGANAIYVVDADDAGNSDLIDASGTADLQGGEVQVFAANGNYAANTNYTILTAGGGVTGTFNSVTSNLAFLTPTLIYTNPNAVILNLVNQNASTGITDFAPYASGSNQAGVANALTEYSASQFGGDTATYNAVSAFNTSEAAQLVKEVTPDEVASLPQVQSAMVTSMQTPLFSRMNTLNPKSNNDTQSYALFTPAAQSLKPDQVWLEAIGGFSSQQANNGAAGYRLGTTGMRGGVDKIVDNNTLVGLSIGHARGNVDYKSSFDKSAVQYTHVDLYGKHHSTRRNLVLEGIIGTGGGRIDSTRPITAGGLNFLADGNTNAYDVTGSIKLSNPIALQASTLIPNITGTMSWQRQNGFTETGAGPFNLTYNATKATPITITPMVNWQKTITSKDDKFSVTPDLGIGATWQPNELERTINANFSGATGTNGFAVNGTKQKPLSLNVTAAVTMIPFTENAAIPNLTAATTIQTNSSNTNGTATINAKWAF